MSSGPPPPTTPPGAGVPPSRPGSHRARRSPYALLAPIVVVAVSVVAVGVGVYGWVTALEEPRSAPDVAAIVSTPTPTSTAPRSPGPSTSHSPRASRSDTPSASPKPSTSAKPSTSPKPTRSTQPPASRDYPVVVLNQTSVTGLAATTAAELRQIGWMVTGVGNWRGNLVQTTVYYPPGQLRSAQQLARDVGTDRIRPRSSPMRTDRLTVILAGRG